MDWWYDDHPSRMLFQALYLLFQQIKSNKFYVLRLNSRQSILTVPLNEQDLELQLTKMSCLKLNESSSLGWQKSKIKTSLFEWPYRVPVGLLKLNIANVYPVTYIIHSSRMSKGLTHYGRCISHRNSSCCGSNCSHDCRLGDQASYHGRVDWSSVGSITIRSTVHSHINVFLVSHQPISSLSFKSWKILTNFCDLKEWVVLYFFNSATDNLIYIYKWFGLDSLLTSTIVFVWICACHYVSSRWHSSKCDVEFGKTKIPPAVPWVMHVSLGISVFWPVGEFRLFLKWRIVFQIQIS